MANASESSMTTAVWRGVVPQARWRINASWGAGSLSRARSKQWRSAPAPGRMRPLGWNDPGV